MAKTVTLKNVLKEINQKLDDENKINVTTIMNKYGSDHKHILQQVDSMLNDNSRETTFFKFSSNNSDAWKCEISIANPTVIFEGRAITKKTAERSAVLALLLWLKEINGYDPYFIIKRTTSVMSKKVKKCRKKKTKKSQKSKLSVQDRLVALRESNEPITHIPFKSDTQYQDLREYLNHKRQLLSENKSTAKDHQEFENSEFSRECDFLSTHTFDYNPYEFDNAVGRPASPYTLKVIKNAGQVIRSSLDCLQQNITSISQTSRGNARRSPIKQLIRHMSTESSTTATRAEIQNTVEPITPSVSNSDQIKKDTSETSSKNGTNICYKYCEETVHVRKLFPTPKNTFHSIYQILSEELKNKNLKISASYKSNKRNWECSYRVKWPENLTFTASDFTKKEASMKAAYAGLSYLLKHKKITEKGAPLLFTQDQIKEITKRPFPSLELKEKTTNTMKKIVDIYKTGIESNISQFSKLAGSGMDAKEMNVEELEDISFQWVSKQKFLGTACYLAKEKVELPISKYKEKFIDLLQKNNVVIVKGEPGCGKSTRIPQYVLESWVCEGASHGMPCRIAVTQPRRIAAISLAERVSKEREESVGHIVGYQVRLNSNFRPQTGRILYCTTGILLRHLQSDTSLSKFSHIILDEAHERDLNTDMLMNLLRTSLEKNKKLKLVVMSATIDADMFQKYYGGAPALEVPGFAFPVKQNFLDTCSAVDVTKTLKMCDSSFRSVVHEDIAKIIQYIHKKKKEGAVLVFLPGWEDIVMVQKLLPKNSPDLAVYCLHSRLQDSDQWKIFSKPPPGVRKVILSTNIAETSVTIDDVVYVVDSGIRKDQRFDVDKGINVIDNHWISKASAIQRKGRAGRVQPGESFHMYPKKTFEQFLDYSEPEILCTSLSKILLQAKAFSNNMNAVEFMDQMPTPPEKNAIQSAVNELKDLELLDNNENLTPLGRTLSEFQMEPNLAKTMVNSVVFKCVTPVVDIVTLFSSEINMFASSLTDKLSIVKAKKQFCNHSDHLAMMRIFEKWLEFVEDANVNKQRQFCNELNLVPHKLQTVNQLRNIHFGYLQEGLNPALPLSDDYSDNDELIKAVLYSGVGTVLQRRNWDIAKNRLRTNVNVLLTRNDHKATITMESINFKRNNFPTDFMFYINETRSNIRRTTLVRECSLIPALSVLLFSHKKVTVQDATGDELNCNLKSLDQVKLGIDGTNINFICDKQQAGDILNCREAIMSTYQYYINAMTQKAQEQANEKINQNWDEILSHLNNILNKHAL